MTTIKNLLPPDPQHAIKKRIYPWEKYQETSIIIWLYEQAKQTGFTGTLEDFKQRYGAFMEATDPADLPDLIDNYEGLYRIIPLMGIQQVLETENKVLNKNIIIEAIPPDLINTNKPVYKGKYHVIPMVDVDQILRTNDKVMEDNVTVERIPYSETSNTAGGYTVTIG